MDKVDLERFAQLIAVLASSFRQEADGAMLEGYRIGLEDVPIDAIELAVHRAIRECKFFPSVSELRELAGEMRPEVRSVKAWDALCKGMAHHGYYNSVDFDDKVINATVRNLGGWMAISDRVDEEGSKWLRKDFERVYAALQSSGVSAIDAGPLIGYFEQTNQLNGYLDAPSNKPKLLITGLPPHRQGVLAAPIPTQQPRALPSASPLLDSIGKKVDE